MVQKAASAYQTISEVSETLDIPAHVLRFWESKFSQLKPMKRSGGRRYYRQEDIALLELIKTLLYDEGYTIKGAQSSLAKRRKPAGAGTHTENAEAQHLDEDRLVTVHPSAQALQEAAHLLSKAQTRIDEMLARL